MRVSKRYQFEFRPPVERLWTVVSDTPRRGEALGMRRYRSHEEPGPDGQVRIPGEFEIAGMRIAWEQPRVARNAELLRDRAVATRSVGLKGFDRPQPVVGFNPLANTATRAAASDGG